MKEITILDKLPIILTKDAEWEPPVAMPGTIILLPEDAILVVEKEVNERI